MTNAGKQIYMSDGTAQIRVWDPASLKEIRRITVKDGILPVTAPNELERSAKSQPGSEATHLNHKIAARDGAGNPLNYLIQE